MSRFSAFRPWIVLALALGATLYGLSFAPLWRQHPPVWEPIGAQRFVYFLAVCALLGALSRWLAPRYARSHLVALTLLGAAALVGPAPVAAVAFVLAGCAALGDIVAALLSGRLGQRQPDQPTLDSGLLAILIFTGLALYVTFFALTAPLRIHYLSVWTALVALPLILNRGFVRRLLRLAARAFAPVDLPSRWHALPLPVLGIGLLAHLVLIPKPEASSDSLAGHLTVCTRLAVDHVFAYDPSVFRWSLMPMAGDFSYAMAYLFGGTLAARLLNFALLGLIVVLIVRLIQRWAPSWVAWLSAGIFVSSPLVQLVTTSLFIENAQVGFLLAAYAALMRGAPDAPLQPPAPAVAPEPSPRGYLLIAGLLAGAALSAKLGSFALALPIAVLAARAMPRRALAILALFLAFGLPPYLNSWARTGNPIFPFLGHIFPSKYSDARTEVNDQRFREKLSWATPYELTFYSSRYIEAQNGAFGFQTLLLLPLVLAVPYRRWTRDARAAFWLSLAAAVVMLLAMPHLRYLYPVLALSAVALAVPLAHSAGSFRWAAIGCTVLVWILNLSFLTSAGWYHKDFLLNPFNPQEAEKYETAWVPEHKFANLLNALEPRATIETFMTGIAPVAYFTGRPYSKAWYSWDSYYTLSFAPNEEAIFNFTHQHAIHWFVGYTAESGVEDPSAPDQRFFRRYTTDVLVSGTERLARLRPEFEYSIELLANPDFQQGLAHWDTGGPVPLLPAEHAVRVTERNHAHELVPVTPGVTYRVAIRARCPEPDTYTRLQVNWTDQSGHGAGVSLIPLKCTAQWADYSTLFTAPSAAANGYFYVTGQNEQPVLIQHASMTW